MIISSVFLIYALFITFSSGALFLIMFEKLLKQDLFEFHSGIVVLFGCAILSVFLQLLHYFFPINLQSHLFVLIMISSGVYFHPVQFKKYILLLKTDFWGDRLQSIFSFCLFIAALINIAGRAGTGDIGDYHLQAIQWAEMYKVIPGLGNLSRQLANNSGWFLIHAFTGCSFLGYKSVYVLNALLLIVAGNYFLPRNGDKYFIVKGTILFYLTLMAFRKYVGSVTNDYAITVFTLMFCMEWIQSNENLKQNKILPLLLLVLILPTLKLSSVITLMIIPFFFIYQIRNHLPWRKAAWILTVSGLLIFLPWIATNRLLSGYLCYPVSTPDLFKTDWKMNSSVLEYELLINKANERVPAVEPTEVIKMPFRQWFPLWLHHLDIFSKFLLSLCILLSVSIMMLMIVQTGLRKDIFLRLTNECSNYLIITFAIAILFWFINAPATRFIFGYLVFFIAWSADLLLIYFLKPNWIAGKAAFIRYLFYSTLFGNLIYGSYFFTKQYLAGDKLASSILVPLPYGINSYDPIKMNNVTLFVPKDSGQCWDCPIPCISKPDSTLEMRGNSLEDGFRRN